MRKSLTTPDRIPTTPPGRHHRPGPLTPPGRRRPLVSSAPVIPPGDGSHRPLLPAGEKVPEGRMRGRNRGGARSLLPRSGLTAACVGLAIALVFIGHPTCSAQELATARPDSPARPIAIWPPGPLEVIAAFDRPLDPAAAKAMIGRTIQYQDTGGGGPDQPSPSHPAGRLRIVGARLVDEGRTLVLATDPHPRVARYLLPLSDVTAPYDLCGVEAAWSEGDDPTGGPKWSGWWPSL